MGSPNIHIHETNQEVVATCHIPWLKKTEDVKIAIKGYILTLSGSVDRITELQEENCIGENILLVISTSRSLAMPCGSRCCQDSFGKRGFGNPYAEG
jgi:HSP20 family protein